MSPSSIDILLATFNGANWLPELLASLERQTCQEWRLLVRDDGSTDGTLDILRGMEIRMGERMDWVAGAKALPGAMGSFDRLLAASTAPYIMFCDQDDVWLPEKVERSMQAMTRMELLHGQGTPVLVYSDLKVVDSELRTLADSFWKHQYLDPRQATYSRLLVQNVVTGCTVVANRALVQKACPIPANACMHDWWLALVAGAFGRLEPVVEPLILYRQHGANAIGAPSPRLTDILRRIARGDTRTYLNWTGHQAKALLQRFGKGLGTFLPPTEALANLEDRSWLGRKRRMLAHRLFLCGWARNLVWLLVS